MGEDQVLLLKGNVLKARKKKSFAAGAKRWEVFDVLRQRKKEKVKNTGKSAAPPDNAHEPRRE